MEFIPEIMVVKGTLLGTKPKRVGAPPKLVDCLKCPEIDP